MKEITKTRLHLKVARPDSDQQALVVIPQPPGCDPVTKVVEGDQHVIRPEDEKIFVGTKDEIEDKVKELRNEPQYCIATSFDPDNSAKVHRLTYKEGEPVAACGTRPSDDSIGYTETEGPATCERCKSIDVFPVTSDEE